MTGTLTGKQLVWIVVAAMLGLVLGFLIISNLSDGQEPVGQQTKIGTVPTTNVGSPTNTGPTGPVVPNVVGQRLPAAEDKLREAGFTQVQERDASPDNRMILEKDNWVVAAQTPEGGSVSPLNTVVVLHVRKNTDAAVPSQAAQGTMPGVACSELHDAEEALHKSGYLLITLRDGTGEGRVPLIDRNWVVIAQSESAGSKPSLTTVITLTVVKHGESTGSSGCLS